MSMPNENILSDELVQAAAALEKRLQILCAPSFKIPSAGWETLPADIRSLIPPWIPALLSNYNLVGAGLQFEHHDRHSTWPILFSFFDPQSFAMILKQGGYYRSLIEFGFFPFANESDGSAWLATMANGPSGKIYLLEHSGWDGGLPTKENGLIYAHKSLAHLLSAMAVNNESFDGKREDCMWGKQV
jgi:hypothetical protein